MLSLEQLLQAKAHPEYFKLTAISGIPSNDNWYALLRESQQKALELSQIETLIFLKRVMKVFPAIQDVCLFYLFEPSANPGYMSIRLMANIPEENFRSDDLLNHLKKSQPENLPLIQAIETVIQALVPEACVDHWRIWLAKDISKNECWHRKADIDKAYKKAMKNSKTLLAGLEKLSLSQVLPTTSKKSSKHKL